MEKKMIKDDLQMAFWLGGLINDDNEDMYAVMHSIMNMSEEELHKLSEVISK